MNAIHRLFQPRSVAVIGASADPQKTAGLPVAYLRKHGFTGAIYPVNPRVDAIDGLRCYADIASLPAVPDVAIVLLGAERAHIAVRELAARGTAAAIVLASGYTETGEVGAQRQAQLRAAAGTMRLLGPNTIGLVNLTDRIVLSASGALDMAQFPTGGVGVVSQSGGIMGSLLSRAAARGMGLSKLVSTSNEADLDLADFIDYLADDDATRVIALYVESVRHPDKFRAAARKAARAGKPVVAFKIGRSEAGARAAVSHTGALAGSDRMVDALFAQVGVIRAHTFGELLDIPCALATGRVLRGQRVAILTSTGGAGALVSDSLGVNGFTTPAPDAPTAARLRALQTGDHAALDRNPIDVTLAGLQPAVLRDAIEALLDSPSYDALVVIAGSSALSQPELMAGAIGHCLPRSDKPVIAYVSPNAPNVVAVLTQRGVPAFAAPEACTSALQGLWQTAVWQARWGQADTPGDVPVGQGVSATNTSLFATELISQLPLDIASGALDEAQSKRLFAHYGIPCVAERVVGNAAEAQAAALELEVQAAAPALNAPTASPSGVVLKILSAQITHKSEVGGVAVNVSVADIGARLDAMRADVARHTGTTPTRFVVQEQVQGGTEMIVGMHRDPLGTAILVGLGGVTAELFGDTRLTLLPSNGGLTAPEVLAMLQALKSWPLLDGYRGRPKADVPALVNAIVAFSNMVARLGPQLEVAEINPLFVLDVGCGVRAADGVVVLGAG